MIQAKKTNKSLDLFYWNCALGGYLTQRQILVVEHIPCFDLGVTRCRMARL